MKILKKFNIHIGLKKKKPSPPTRNKSKSHQLIPGIYKKLELKSYLMVKEGVHSLTPWTRKKARIFTLTTPTHHRISNPSQCKKQEEEIKHIQTRIEDVK